MPQSQKTLEFLQKLKDKGHWNDTMIILQHEVLKKEIESIGFKIVEVTTSSQFVYIHGIKL